MLKILLPISILLSFLFGVFFGARAGLETQMYYDAPNKIKILSHQLDNDDPKSIPLGQIINQIKILNESEELKFKTPLILKFFPDGDILASQFEKNYPEIEKSIHYQEALNFLCTWNEKYKDKCKKSL